MRSASGTTRVVEEDLGEVRVAVHLPQRPHVDARRAHVEAERGDALRASARSGRAGRAAGPNASSAPRLVHTFWPLTRHSSPSRVARVATPARSEPAPGSENSWHQISAPVAIGGSQRAHCSGVAVREQRRPDQLEPDEVRVEVGDVEVGELAADDADLGRCRPEPAVLDRPRRHGEPPSAERARGRRAPASRSSLPAPRTETAASAARGRSTSASEARICCGVELLDRARSVPRHDEERTRRNGRRVPPTRR